MTEIIVENTGDLFVGTILLVIGYFAARYEINRYQFRKDVSFTRESLFKLLSDLRYTYSSVIRNMEEYKLLLNLIQENLESSFKKEIELEKIQKYGNLSNEIAVFESKHLFLITKIIIHFSRPDMKTVSVLTKSLSYEECIEIFEKAIKFFEGFLIKPLSYKPIMFQEMDKMIQDAFRDMIFLIYKTKVQQN